MTSKPVWRNTLSLNWPACLLSLATTCALFCILIPAAHGDPSEVEEPPNTQISPLAVTEDPGEAFKKSIQQMANTLFAHIGNPDPESGDLANGIAVSSFVDLKKLTRTSSFGRYLSEQLATEFQQQGYRVIEIRKSTAIMIQEKRGEYGLSRDMAELNNAVAARTLISGTYTLAGDHILVNAKVLDNKSAALISSATVVFPRTQLTDFLLADSISAAPVRKQEVSMTMLKRLEP